MAKAAADDAAFFRAEADVASFADGRGVIADAAIAKIIISPVWPEGIVPEEGARRMNHVCIGGGAVTADIDLLALAVCVDPVVTRSMAGSQGGGDENEGDVF